MIRMRPIVTAILFCMAIIAIIACFEIYQTVGLAEELPVNIVPKNILYGEIMAYHPDILYMKYGLSFVIRNIIVERQDPREQDSRIKNYYYYVNQGQRITSLEKQLLQKDNSQSFLKFRGENNKYYLLTISGDHEGSANYRDMTVKLYEWKNAQFTEIFHRSERYSTDPGIDSDFYCERLKLFLYKTLFNDQRYR